MLGNLSVLALQGQRHVVERFCQAGQLGAAGDFDRMTVLTAGDFFGCRQQPVNRQHHDS